MSMSPKTNNPKNQNKPRKSQIISKNVVAGNVRFEKFENVENVCPTDFENVDFKFWKF